MGIGCLRGNSGDEPVVDNVLQTHLQNLGEPVCISGVYQSPPDVEVVSGVRSEEEILCPYEVKGAICAIFGYFVRGPIGRKDSSLGIPNINSVLAYYGERACPYIGEEGPVWSFHQKHGVLRIIRIALMVSPKEESAGYLIYTLVVCG